MSHPYIIEPERKTPIACQADVIVVGGGTAGSVAALASAREGAFTVLIERLGSLGGCMTLGRCTHLSNIFLDGESAGTIEGIPLEIISRLAQSGGTPFPDAEQTLKGKLGIPNFLLVDPEILAVVLLEMAQEAGVKLMLNTTFCDPILEGDAIKGVVVQSKAGRHAVLGRNVVDASGEADVAHASGAPCVTNPPEPWYLTTFGLLMRMGNVDTDRFVAYLMSIDAGNPNPGFEEWLSRHLGLTLDELRQHRYWRRFLDPLPVGGVPKTHPGARRFTTDTQRWYEDRWKAEGIFAYVNMQLFRDLLRKAEENGDLQMLKRIEGFGEIGFNFDGLSSSRWRKGEVVFNAVNPMNGFDAFDAEHISRVEVEARKRALELARFFIKYVPGFQEAHLIDTGAQTMPRHARFIDGEYAMTAEDVRDQKSFDDAVYLTASEPTPGMAHQVPYRMMLPKRIDHLIVAGKCASGAHHVRPIPSMMAMGQAAGVAAALASRLKVSPRKLDIAALQGSLRKQGVKLTR